MILLDTDTLTLFLLNHARVVERIRSATDEIAITIISRIETLQGRFASLLKAANGAELQRGQRRLNNRARFCCTNPTRKRGTRQSLAYASGWCSSRFAHAYIETAERDLATISNIVPIDAAAAVEFDRLRENKKLKKIGRADLLIACIALARRAPLVTRNLKHFLQVPGLQLENWAD